LGLTLESPLVLAPSPVSRDLGVVQRAEELGAGAVVMFSLFAEQFVVPARGRHAHDESAKGLDVSEFLTRPREYLELLRSYKRHLGIPVIASINAAETGQWVEYARSLEDAGADALELNIYKLGCDPRTSGAAIEAEYVEILGAVKAAVSIPVAVKLAPYFSSFAAFAARLDASGADGLVLFNRFYEPDIDVERRCLVGDLELSSRWEARLPMMWIAMLRGEVRASLAATTGIHSAVDVVKMIMAGADVTMLCSILIKEGIDMLGVIRDDLVAWLDTHGISDLAELRGVMSRHAADSLDDYGRTGYAKVLSRYW
jgi:dihydroorotate dehydrogenase (fumarate)